ncbi:MAG: electron transfer flavoprotein subunit alpha/FixB family protein [Arachidicoccus sp.]|nr:electron transfer flavoprotein subunit alpha/FixB family protein [Arachidicoccus sp.]
MSVLVYIEPHKGNIKKTSLEAVSYANKLAELISSNVTALAINISDEGLKAIANAGADKILSVNNESLSATNIKALAEVVNSAIKEENATTIIFAADGTGSSVAPYVAAKQKAGIIAGTIDFPIIDGNKLIVQKNVFSGKATALYSVDTAIKIITLTPNSIQISNTKRSPNVISFAPTFDAANGVVLKSFKIDEDIAKGGIPLADAELVVSGGRGLKGPENWGIVEDLAHALGAATACSRPVADADWRPHHEHVGQTGLAIRPNLYIAIGISGAIQHLAGVNGSKTIVVINNDPEAPFFKNADYGILGDAFKVVPKLTEAIKKLRI